MVAQSQVLAVSQTPEKSEGEWSTELTAIMGRGQAKHEECCNWGAKCQVMRTACPMQKAAASGVSVSYFLCGNNADLLLNLYCNNLPNSLNLLHFFYLHSVPKSQDCVLLLNQTRVQVQAVDTDSCLTVPCVLNLVSLRDIGLQCTMNKPAGLELASKGPDLKPSRNIYNSLLLLPFLLVLWF